MTKTWEATILAVLLLSIPGCGGLRYSQVSPEAKDFHPRRIAVLPADATTFPEAKGTVDRLFTELLSERGWFSSVVGGETLKRRLETDAELRQTASDYLAKLDKVSFSDPALSSRIGALIDAEALLLVRVDYWNYTTEQDKKVGKVSLSIVMIEAKTGKTVWTAIHHRISDYLIIKPDLSDMARGLIREMIGYMPR
ncbi:MAG: hypothetical protein FJ122_13825 [Deltaproteobacteria bacterium]|nr:hypothetical protein [Deltaproteobacteria bacterium]